MRNTRTPEQWLALFDEQQRSGLNQTQFCRLHAITRSAFSSARCRLSASASAAPATAFVPAFPPDPDACDAARPDPLSPKVAARLPTTAPQLALILPGATLSLPVDTSPLWLASLLREMTR